MELCTATLEDLLLLLVTVPDASADCLVSSDNLACLLLLLAFLVAETDAAVADCVLNAPVLLPVLFCAVVLVVKPMPTPTFTFVFLALLAALFACALMAAEVCKAVPCALVAAAFVVAAAAAFCVAALVAAEAAALVETAKAAACCAAD